VPPGPEASAVPTSDSCHRLPMMIWTVLGRQPGHRHWSGEAGSEGGDASRFSWAVYSPPTMKMLSMPASRFGMIA